MVKKKKQYVVAVVGATGVVGREMVQLLEERAFPVDQCRLFASERTAGEQLAFCGNKLGVEKLEKDSFEGVDFALFSAGEKVSREFASAAAAAGAVVIDNSPEWRMDPGVPLVVPEVNPEAALKHKGIIANPNCSTIQLVVALKPLHDSARIQRIIVSTYQSVSGTGKDAMEELMGQTRDLLSFKEAKPSVYPSQIAFNLLPHIGSFDEEGYSTEEMKLVNETRRIFGESDLRITATTVRVPVFRSHAESVLIETEKALAPNEARAILSTAPGVRVFDDPGRKVYPMPLDVSGTDDVFVGRIRRDLTHEKGLNLWIVADNLRKGAALNAVQIAELLVRNSNNPG